MSEYYKCGASVRKWRPGGRSWGRGGEIGVFVPPPEYANTTNAEALDFYTLN